MRTVMFSWLMALLCLSQNQLQKLNKSLNKSRKAEIFSKKYHPNISLAIVLTTFSQIRLVLINAICFEHHLKDLNY